MEQERTFWVHSMRILDWKRKKLWNWVVNLVKVQWTWYGPEDATWEHEDAMQAEYQSHMIEVEGGAGKCFLGASGAYARLEKQESLESSHRAFKSSVDLVRS